MDTTDHHIRHADIEGLDLRVLGEEWNERLLQRMNESPIDTGRFRILFDRSPDIFVIPKLTSYKYRCLGLFDKNDLLGVAFAMYQQRYLNQRLNNVIYLGNIHTFRKGSGGVLLRLLSNRLGRILREGTPADYIYAYVADRNIPAMKLADHGYFHSRVVGQIVMKTLLLLCPVKQNRTYEIKQATRADIPDIVRLLEQEHQQRVLSPAISRESVVQQLTQRPGFRIDHFFIALRNNQPVGVCSAWDMTSIKKNIILSYNHLSGMTRLAYNMVATITGAETLPAAGKPFRDITIAEYAVSQRDPEVMEALLRYIANHYRNRGYNSIIFGSDVRDPLLLATKPFITQEIRSNVLLGKIDPSASSETAPGGLLYADAVLI